MIAMRGSSSQTAVAETSKEDAEGRAVNEEQQFRARARLLGAVLIGDFFHNLCDGFFIGAAFQVCGNAFGWSIATGTILHELPQEIADFVVLTGGSEHGSAMLRRLTHVGLSELGSLFGSRI